MFVETINAIPCVKSMFSLTLPVQSKQECVLPNRKGFQTLFHYLIPKRGSGQIHRRRQLDSLLADMSKWFCYLLEITESIRPYFSASSALIKLSLSVSLSISSIVRPVFSDNILFNLCLFFCI